MGDIIIWRKSAPAVIGLVLLAASLVLTHDSNRIQDDVQRPLPISVDEARIRARLLHEAFAGALQVMHRDYFREGQRMKLPSKSLEDVFTEMTETHQVKLKWLAVNANAMSVDHVANTDFEKQAVKSLDSEKDEYEQVTKTAFHYAGAIRLSASCVKCHVRNRTSNDAKKAALVITIPLTAKMNE